MSQNNHPASFRDPSGFIFKKDGDIYRQVNNCYREHYDLLMSGLYQRLVTEKLLISHEEVESVQGENVYKVIRPQKISFISYPYEWCFGQLQDAALTTLKIQKIALEFGMTLKDASFFNIQFIGSCPVFIDTLSFEKYEAGRPWVAYKQFCENFLAPLTLEAYTDVRLSKLLISNIDGIPLDLVAKLLPIWEKLRPTVFLHILLHAKSQRKYAEEAIEKNNAGQFGKLAFLGLLDNLTSFIEKLKLKKTQTVWTEYYLDNNCVSYENDAIEDKTRVVNNFISDIAPKTVWDIGANSGRFSEIASAMGAKVVAMDFDSTVVEKNYQNAKNKNNKKILPLVVDFTNPSPAIGWHNTERDSLLNREVPDLVMALALVHHLAIGKNLPLCMIAKQFSELSQNLIIEFVPKVDKQVQVLLQSREDIFSDYNQEKFETEFAEYFLLIEKVQLKNSERFVYRYTKKNVGQNFAS